MAKRETKQDKAVRAAATLRLLRAAEDDFLRASVEGASEAAKAYAKAKREHETALRAAVK